MVALLRKGVAREFSNEGDIKQSSYLIVSSISRSELKGKKEKLESETVVLGAEKEQSLMYSTPFRDIQSCTFSSGSSHIFSLLRCKDVTQEKPRSVWGKKPKASKSVFC